MVQDARVSFPKEMVEGSIAARFEQQAALYPDKIAVKDQDLSFTYLELNTAANRIARTIQASQFEDCETVAMLFEHGASAVTSILGILKAGKAYVPLDPAFPIQRLKYMLEDSQAGFVLTNNKSLSVSQNLYADEGKIINIDEIAPNYSGENLDLSIPTETLALIMYSSGSTGKPKGIVQNHRNILHHIWDHTTLYNFGNNENQALILSFSFAASVSEIFSPLLNGGTLSLYNIKKGSLVDLASWIEKQEISVIKIPISLFRIFLGDLTGADNFPKLRLVILGGDTLFRKDLMEFRKYFSSDCVLVNRLTSTETNSVTQLVIEPGMEINNRIIPVGYPAQDKEVMILGDDGQTLGLGEIGEIVIKSRYITPGYWQKPEFTQERFQDSAEDSGSLIFYTGDLGRLRTDGCLEHLGRKDFMVKIRGFRVEIAEITAALLEMDTIIDAVVIATPDSTGEKQLVAYVVPDDLTPDSIHSLRNKLSEDLPVYMIPSEFVVLDKLPKTPTGKIDYKNLPSIETTRPNLENAYSPPRTSVEKQLVKIWEQVLNQKTIGIHDDFFDLGGNSLDALRMLASAEREFKKPLTLPLFIQSRTIENLARKLEDDNTSTPFSHIIALSDKGSKPPFFCIPPSATTVMTFGKLAQYMQEERPFYGFEYTGMDGKTNPHQDIKTMAATYLEEMRTIQPEGPYFLGGMCFGGLVAFEMAQQLLSHGQKVAFLGILDSTHAPNLSTPRGYYVFIVTRFINQKILKGKFTFGSRNIRIPGDDVYRNQVQHVFASHNVARMKYRTSPFPGKITLFNTAGEKGLFARKQWATATTLELEVILIPGAHTGHGFGLSDSEDTFIREPHVQVLAKKLNENLDKAIIIEKS